MRRHIRRAAGFTLVELLITMLILSVILIISLALLNSSQQAANLQQAKTGALNDARAALSRVTESLSAASYIYPAGVTITVASDIAGQGGNQVVTGPGAVAMLVWDGVNTAPPRYKGVVYYLTDRANFAADLGSAPAGSLGSSALVELTTQSTSSTGTGAIPWPVNGLPIRAWPAVTEGAIADGVDAGRSTLMGALPGDANLAATTGLDDTQFAGGTRGQASSLSDPKALVASLTLNLTVNVAPQGRSVSASGGTPLQNVVTARNVPRQ